jgi:hypothetical protein
MVTGSMAMIVDAPAIAGALHGAEAERSAADNRHRRSRSHLGERARRRGAQAGDADTAEHHAEIDGRRGADNRHDPLFERHHQFGETTDVRVGVHRRAVAHVGNRHEVGRQVAAEQLTDIGAAAQAVIAGPALRRPRHAHPIADLHAAHVGAHGLDDTNAAMALDERHVGRPGGERVPPAPAAGGGGSWRPRTRAELE